MPDYPQLLTNVLKCQICCWLLGESSFKLQPVREQRGGWCHHVEENLTEQTGDTNQWKTKCFIKTWVINSFFFPQILFNSLPALYTTGNLLSICANSFLFACLLLFLLLLIVFYISFVCSEQIILQIPCIAVSLLGPVSHIFSAQVWHSFTNTCSVNSWRWLSK